MPKTVWCKNVCHLQMVLIEKKLVRERERKGKGAEMFRIVKKYFLNKNFIDFFYGSLIGGQMACKLLDNVFLCSSFPSFH